MLHMAVTMVTKCDNDMTAVIGLIIYMIKRRI